MRPCCIRFPSWWPPFARLSSRISPSGPFLLVSPHVSLPWFTSSHPGCLHVQLVIVPLPSRPAAASNTSAHLSPRCTGWACHDAAAPLELVPLLGILLVPPVCGPICRWTVFLSGGLVYRTMHYYYFSLACSCMTCVVGRIASPWSLHVLLILRGHSYCMSSCLPRIGMTSTSFFVFFFLYLHCMHSHRHTLFRHSVCFPLYCLNHHSFPILY